MAVYPKIGLFAFIWQYVSKYKIAFFWMFLLNSFWSLERVFFPYLIGNVIDRMTFLNSTGGNKSDWINLLKTPLFSAIALLVVSEIGFRVCELISARVWPKFMASMRSETFDNSMYQSARFFSTNYAGSIGAKVSNLVQYTSNIVEKIIQVSAPVFGTVISSIVMMYIINVKIGHIYFGWTVIYVLIILSSITFCKKYANISAEKLINLDGKIVDVINCMANVRIFARQAEEMRYYWKFQNQEIKAKTKASLAILIVNSILSTISVLGIVGLLCFSIWSWSKDNLTIGEVSAVVAIIISTNIALWWLSHETILFFTDYGKAEQALTLVNEHYEIEDAPNAIELKVKEGRIEFKDAVFSHNNKTFFAHQDVVIEAGSHVGLVGHSGSGKTTLINLILREYNLDSGQIFIDGQDIAKVTLDSLHKSIAFIPQEVLLFHRTVKIFCKTAFDSLTLEH